MTRISAAVPAVPTMITGTIRCMSRSKTLPTLHGAVRYSLENNPKAEFPVARKNNHRKISANRKLGIARPMNPTNVNA